MVTFSVANHAPHTFSPFDIEPPLTGNATTDEHGYEHTSVLEKLASNHGSDPRMVDTEDLIRKQISG